MDSDRIKSLWSLYSKKNSYAKDIEADEILILLRNFIEKLNLELITV